MAESRIIMFFICLWKTLVNWYEASALAKVINAFCNFFIRHGKDSVIVKAFLHGFCTGNWWKNSLLYTAMCSALQGKKTDKQAQSGAILTAILNIFQIPLSHIGAILLSFAAALVPLMLVFQKATLLNTLVAAALFVLGVLCLILRRSLYALYLGSKVLSFFGGFFYEGEYKEPKDYRISLLPTCVFAAVLGAACGATTPLLAVLAICAILFAAAVLLRFEIGVFATLFLASFLPTSLVAGLCVLTIGGFLLALLSGRIRNLRPSVLAPILAFYVLVSVFSTATSFAISGSLFVFAVYFVFLCTYVVLVNTLKNKALWRAAVVTFAVSAAFIALFGIAQNFLLDSTTQNWVDSSKFEDIKTRVFATFDNPNVLGQYFIITIPIIFALFVSFKKPLQKTTWLGVFGICFLCLIYTWSRSAWVGVMLGIVLFLLWRDRRWIVLCIIGLFLMPFVMPASIMDRLLSLVNTGDSSTAYRVSVWISTARMALDFWPLGVGYGADAFAAIYSTYALNGAGYALHAHNFYLQLLADVGIGGLVSYLLVLFTSYREIALVKNDKLIKNVTLALGGVLAGYMFQGLAESMWYNLRMSLMFWIAIALIVSGAKLDKESAE